MPLTAAKIGLRSWRRVYSVRSKSWRWRSQSSLVMFLRWRRSLPTEKARSPAPVMTAARIVGRTAIVSRISVRRAPISVVMALSACGRFRVMSTTRPSIAYSTSTGCSGSARSDGGGPKSSAFQRSVLVGVLAMSSSFDRSGVELRQPAKGLQPRRKAVLAAAGDHERRQRLEPSPDGPLRDREPPGPVVRPDERVLLGRSPDEDAVVQPLGLDELELALRVRAREHEDDAAVGTVVLEHAFGQHRAIARAAADHPVEADVDAALVVECIARVRAARVGAHRALEAAQIVLEAEGVVALRIGAEVGVVLVRRERERRSALPAPDHLGAEQRFLFTAGGLLAKVPPVRGHARVQLAEDDVGAVPTEHLRSRHRRQAASLVRVAEQDLAGLERWLTRVRALNAASLDRWLADPVLESERGPSGRELVAVLAPNQLHAEEPFLRSHRALENRVQPSRVRRQRGHRDVDVRRAKRLLPVLRAALTDVTELGGARCHPLFELRREAVQGLLRHAERLQALIGEGSGDPCVARGLGRDPAEVDHVGQPPHELPARVAVVDPEEKVAADIRSRPLVQRSALDVVELEGDLVSGGLRVHASGARGAREGPG